MESLTLKQLTSSGARRPLIGNAHPSEVGFDPEQVERNGGHWPVKLDSTSPADHHLFGQLLRAWTD